jgi:hypothetical protein
MCMCLVSVSEFIQLAFTEPSPGARPDLGAKDMVLDKIEKTCQLGASGGSKHNIIWMCCLNV